MNVVQMPRRPQAPDVKRDVGPRGEVIHTFDGPSLAWAVTTARNVDTLRLEVTLRGATIETWLHRREAVTLRHALAGALLEFDRSHPDQAHSSAPRNG